MDNKAIDVGIITIIPTEIKALLSVLNVNGNFEHREYGDANYLKTEIFSQKVNFNFDTYNSLTPNWYYKVLR